jgi:hypothetical protein
MQPWCKPRDLDRLAAKRVTPWRAKLGSRCFAVFVAHRKHSSVASLWRHAAANSPSFSFG